MTTEKKTAQNRAAGLLEDLKRSKGHLHDALFWCQKLDSTHIDHSYFDHAVSVTALKHIEDMKKLVVEAETMLKHLQSKGLK